MGPRSTTTNFNIGAKEALELELKGGILPIPLKLKLMRYYWGLATNGNPEGEIVSLVHAELAAEQADGCAPYVHPKIASIDVSGNKENPLRFLFAPEDEKL